MKSFEDVIDEIIANMDKQRENARIKAFVTDISMMLRENGVIPCMSEVPAEIDDNDALKTVFCCRLEKLDFSEHDKVFEDKIKSLQDECAKLHKQLMETEKDMQDEIVILNKQIADLQWELAGKEVDEEKTEPVKESLPSIEWFDNRHQSDCIEINRLNTTIDVLIHKVEYLRQFVGLE